MDLCSWEVLNPSELGTFLLIMWPYWYQQAGRHLHVSVSSRLRWKRICQLSDLCGMYPANQAKLDSTCMLITDAQTYTILTFCLFMLSIQTGTRYHLGFTVLMQKAHFTAHPGNEKSVGQGVFCKKNQPSIATGHKHPL